MENEYVPKPKLFKYLILILMGKMKRKFQSNEESNFIYILYIWWWKTVALKH